MTASEDPTTKEAPVKRRGPRKESEIRAEIEAQFRAEMEAKLEAKEASIRAEIATEMAAKEAAAAKERALAAEARPISGRQIDGDPSVEGSITVHFLEDGLTLLGKVWYRGEELTINPGTENWAAAASILELDEFAQEERWGKRFFRPGVWRGKRLDEIDDPELTEDEKAALKKAAHERDLRYGVVTGVNGN